MLPDSSPCAKTGCISNVPALRAPTADFGIDMLAVASAAPALPAGLVLECASEIGAQFPSYELFPKNHSLLI